MAEGQQAHQHQHKRGRQDEDPPGVGRGAGRPPGAPPAHSIHETLALIQSQLALQTEKMGKLAEKDDIKGLSDRVGAAEDQIVQNKTDIAGLRSDAQADKTAVNDRVSELERRLDLLAQSGSGALGSGAEAFNKEKYQREKYLTSRRSLRLWPVNAVYTSDDQEVRFTQERAAACVFMRDFLKASNHFQSIQEVLTPPTRGDENLDIVFTNMSRSVTSVEVCPPLIPDQGRPGRPSDHNLVVVGFELERKKNG